jgi:sensor histidine kinase YesM
MVRIPYIELFRRHRTRIVWSALLFWLLIGFFVYSTEWIASHYFGMKAIDPIEQRQYLLRWVLWLLLTPIIILFGLRFNVGNCKLPWLILLHILLGTALLTLEFLAELAIIKPMAESFYRRPVATGELIIPFLMKYFAYIINYFLIVGMVNIYVYMQSLQATQRNLLQTELQNKDLSYRLTLAQLQTLRMQIQPHFLFNVHHSVVALILQQENDKAAKMLTALSDLLRLALEQQEEELIPLSEELRMIGHYLSIQQIRFEERFTYTSEVPEAAGNIRVPYFILQPIVENAVIHGIEQTDEAASLTITAALDEEKLQIGISNTGSLPAISVNKGMGIGLNNVRERLYQYYGSKASFHLREEPEGITVATLIIPTHER